MFWVHLAQVTIPENYVHAHLLKQFDPRPSHIHVIKTINPELFFVNCAPYAAVEATVVDATSQLQPDRKTGKFFDMLSRDYKLKKLVADIPQERDIELSLLCSKLRLQKRSRDQYQLKNSIDLTQSSSLPSKMLESSLF
ncbi:hypothetical protein SDJN02_03667, partial [Cucurbita argyrosperma subsp. argyrosperma]